MNCLKCDSIISEQDKFCHNCGTKIESQKNTKAESVVKEVKEKKSSSKNAILFFSLIYSFILYNVFSNKYNIGKSMDDLATTSYLWTQVFMTIFVSIIISFIMATIRKKKGIQIDQWKTFFIIYIIFGLFLMF